MMEDTSIEMKDVSGNMAPPPETKESSIFSKIPIQNPYLILKEVRQNLRPWSVFLNWSNFRAPANLGRLSTRVVRNLSYFSSNYLVVFLGLVVYCLLTSPLILIVLAGVMYACYKIKQANIPFTLAGRQLNTNQQCLLVNVASIPILYLCGAGGMLFWVLGATCFICSLHAAFFAEENLVLEEDQETFLAEVV